MDSFLFRVFSLFVIVFVSLLLSSSFSLPLSPSVLTLVSSFSHSVSVYLSPSVLVPPLSVVVSLFSRPSCLLVSYVSLLVLNWSRMCLHFALALWCQLERSQLFHGP